jgi:hypothetical protein
MKKQFTTHNHSPPSSLYLPSFVINLLSKLFIMNNKFAILSVSLLFVFCFTQCKKDSTDIEDPRNHSLRKKTLEEIRNTIKGTWEFKKIYGCGFAGCNSTPIAPGDILYFLPNDTVKRVTNGVTTIYEKAEVSRTYIYAFSDTGYVFKMGGRFTSLVNG